MIRRTSGTLTSIKKIEWGQPNQLFKQAYLPSSVELTRLALMAYYPMLGTTVHFTRCAGGEGLSLHAHYPKEGPGQDDNYIIFLHPANTSKAVAPEPLAREEKYLLMREYLLIRLERDGFNFRPTTTNKSVLRFMRDLREWAAYYMAEAEICRNFENNLENEMIMTLNHAQSHFFSHINSGLDAGPPTILLRTLMLRTLLSAHRSHLPFSFPEIFFNDYYRLGELAEFSAALKGLDPRAPFAYETTLTEVCRLLTGSGLEFQGLKARIMDEDLVINFLAGGGRIFRRREFVAAVNKFSADHGISLKERAGRG